jgi:hypothetical protein
MPPQGVWLIASLYFTLRHRGRSTSQMKRPRWYHAEVMHSTMVNFGLAPFRDCTASNVIATNISHLSTSVRHA